MLFTWFTQLGDRNPQLLREVKGRVTLRNGFITVAISLITQFFIVGSFWNVVGSPLDTLRQSDGFRLLRFGWFEICAIITWVAVLALLFLGSYLLVNDITKEEQHSTFDFVRLSPQPAHSILLGKLLGVPILLYAAIALAMPLHLWAAINAGLSLLTIASVYLLAGASCALVYTFAMLYTLSWGVKAEMWYVLPVVGCIYFLLCLFSFYGINQYQELEVQDSISIASFEPNFLLIFSFLLVTFVVLAFCFWWDCLYRFHHPPLRR